MDEDLVEPAELRIYQVPQEYQQDLRDMLQSALGNGDTRIGRVTNGPGGTLLVVAPAPIQAGIQQILDAGFEAPPASSPVTLTYWLVVGRPVDPSRATQPFTVVGTRGFEQLEPVLTQIATAEGPTEFSVLEQIQLTSMSQHRAQTNGRFGQVTQRATRTGEQVVADVTINMIGNQNLFQSQVMLNSGQFLVLGQTGFAGNTRVFPDAGSEDLLTLYYVMAADLEP